MKEPITIMTIGDPHFKIKNVEQTREMVSKIIRLANERQPDLIVCLGDVLDRHARLHTDPLCDSVNLFVQLNKISPLIVIIGNHDRRNNSDFLTDRHPFTAMKLWPNVQIADIVQTRWCKGHHLVFVPYVPPGRFIEALDTYHSDLDQDEWSIINQQGHEWLNEWNLALRVEEINRSVGNSDYFLDQIIGSTGQQQLTNLFDNQTLTEISNLLKHHLQLKLQRRAEQFLIEQKSANNEIIQQIKDLTLTEEKVTGLLEEKITEESSSNNSSNEDYSKQWWWSASVIFAHQEFRGAKMGAIISEKGDIWPTDGPLVVSGHIHDYQRPQDNIWYTGTPIQHAFGDTLDKKITMLHWTEREGWTEERIDLGLIKRKTIKLKATELMEWQPPPGFLVKVVVEGTPGELRTLSALPRMTQLEKSGVLVKIKTLPQKRSINLAQQTFKPTQSYLTALYLEVLNNFSNKDQLLNWYRQIFGQSRIDDIKQNGCKLTLVKSLENILALLLNNTITPVQLEETTNLMIRPQLTLNHSVRSNGKSLILTIQNSSPV